MKQLTKAIIAVMKSVKNIEKNSNVGTGQNKYKGIQDKDVKIAFSKAFEENGLCILPIDIEESTDITTWEETNQYGTKQKKSVFTKVKTKYLLIHESGEQIELIGYGHGVDSQDKGAGKATTYALKNCLLYTFLTPTGAIDDADSTHSDDIELPETKTKLVKKEKLTEEGYKYLISDKAKVEEIDKALAIRIITEDQKKGLSNKKEELTKTK